MANLAVVLLLCAFALAIATVLGVVGLATSQRYRDKTFREVVSFNPPAALLLLYSRWWRQLALAALALLVIGSALRLVFG